MSGSFIFLAIFLVIVCMMLVISKFNQYPFIVLTVIAIAVGLVYGIPTREVTDTVESGFGNILASTGIVILAGTIIGTILGKTGAALTMANTILRMVGKGDSVPTMVITGYVTGIPVFCDSGLVILGPISKTLANQSNVSLAIMATALSGGLYATHCLVPPTPGLITMAGTLKADLGLIILVGPLASIPTTLPALICAKKVSSKIGIPANPEHTVDELLQKYGKLPGTLYSFSPILLPIVLIALKFVGDFPSAPFGDGVVRMFFSSIGNLVITLILGMFLAMTLVPAAEKENTLSWITKDVTDPVGVLVIIDADGAFGVILQRLPTVDTLSAPLLSPGIGVFLPFIIVALLKAATGVSTVAIIITSATTTPLMSALGFTPLLVKVLVIIVVGVGSMTVFYANDPCFQVVSQFSDMEIRDVYKRQADMTGAMSIMTIIVVFLPSLVFVH